MNCNDVEQLAPAFLSGELPADRTSEFQSHLDSCFECQRLMTGQAELDARLRHQILADVPDTAALDLRVRQAIAIVNPARRRFISPRLAIAALAAILILALAVALRSRLRAQPVELCSDAARDHLREIVHQEPRRWTAGRAGVETLGQRVGLAPEAVSAFSVSGYRLERGRLCRLDGRVFLHLVYSNGARQFSLFLTSAGAFTDSGLFATEVSGEHVATIQSSHARAVVVTEESGDAARALARIAMSAL